MKKYASTFLIITLITSNLWCQYFGPQIADSVLKINNVNKCIEFDTEDSMAFFNDYPNAFYWVYNEEGKEIEANTYSFGDSIIEFKIHSIYDHLGRIIMMLWYDKSSPNKIIRVRQEEYNEQ
ncbi:hypothetical protein SAMN05216474_0044 [Lishizhenia tianjinensis]|uniref:Uncharacterized protein n=1 Tax=Lishizhenia tianjinensis TaxID=477690 RepID=A0A1I6X9U7_9FLAO|nr:hypothetical protein [Lishizhenia tianjinensis]SFT35138.1 hypothetical protein SAMN05216474_0044 [Lishizhenia tianjinensis]